VRDRRAARCAWRLGGAVLLLALFGCASGSDGEADSTKACAAQGLTSGTEAYDTCVERQQLQQQMELQRIGQAREAARGGTKL
jgi:hypothetical protein